MPTIPETVPEHLLTPRAGLPPAITATTTISDPPGAGPFPEFLLGSPSQRYLPTERPLGVCISGGGIRSISAAIGQIRAMTGTLGNLMNMVGALSTVSGGTWFNTIYSFASQGIDDATLLGPMIEPENLTWNDVSIMPQGFLASGLQNADNRKVLEIVAELSLEIKFGFLPENRLWSRLLNELYLTRFGIGDVFRSFSLNGGGPLNTYAMRPDRPYYIANSTQISPVGLGQYMRHFEYTPLYSGTAQLFRNTGPQSQDFGGGYVESAAFDSTEPIAISPLPIVHTPDPLFTLSDAMGSSSAAPEATFDRLNINRNGFPEFNYWPPMAPGRVPSARYVFADGGSLEDVGIVPLLRRQYPYVIAFVNAELPIGSNSSMAVNGISEQVSRLFGVMPKDTAGNNQWTQVFGKDQTEGQKLFEQLSAALNDNAGNGAAFADTYTITPGNSFAIPAYPSTKTWPYLGSGQVRVLWFYLNLNTGWKAALENNPDKRIPEQLSDRDRGNNFESFPNYDTLGQNWDFDIFGYKLREPLQLNPTQVQLLANMTAYSVQRGNGADLLSEAHAELVGGA